MGEVLFRYERLEPTSWAYLASLLAIALYFKFSRFWSVRNLDLVGLILFAPPLLLVKYGMDNGATDEQARLVEHVGYIWLFAVSGLFMLRLLFDATMVRRPLLEPNLTVGGLTFLGISLFAFLMANVVTGPPARLPMFYWLPQKSAQSLTENDAEKRAPLPAVPTNGEGQQNSALSGSDLASEQAAAAEPSEIPYGEVVTARVVAVLSQLAIVVGMMLVGMRHFDNVKTGIAAATFYLLLPYTALWTGNVIHSLPGALITWAVVMYRRPLVAGSMIALAFGTIYCPVFLLPLWISFYWSRGLWRFLIGVLATLAVLVAVLAFTADDVAMFIDRLRQMFDVRFPNADGLNTGAWQFWQPIYRFPIVAAFIGLSLSLVLWPAQKNLGTLIAYSGAVMLGTQFWHAHTGGLALAWYLPLLLLTIFRPNLEDRLALAVVK